MDLIRQMRFSLKGSSITYPLPAVLRDSFQLISDFFNRDKNNKLCLVFPTKEYAAQWLSIPATLSLIKSDFNNYKNKIAESLKNYEKDDLLIINNEAVVQWVGKSTNGFVFKHKEHNGVSTITIDLKKISIIQPAPLSRKALSSYKRVIVAIGNVTDNPTDKLLGIQTRGNRLYQKNSICLISKYISFANSISETLLNGYLIEEYFKPGKIDDSGEVDMKSPMLISNSLANLALYLTLSDDVSMIVVDSYSIIQERDGDFNDIDAKKISTILITDLSEIENFQGIADRGFDFYNFTKDKLELEQIDKSSPFKTLEIKLNRYASFMLKKEICKNDKLELVARLIHSIESDESVKELMTLKAFLIQITNIVSRIAYQLSLKEKEILKEKVDKIETHFRENKYYIGGSVGAIENAISDLRILIEKFAAYPSEKSSRMKELLELNQYDYIVCVTEAEVFPLTFYLNSLQVDHMPKIISIADFIEGSLDCGFVKIILIGWAKSTNISRLLSSFQSSDLTALFYEFENRYFNSLQNRNNRLSSNVKSTINKYGSRSNLESKNDFADLYKIESRSETNANFDITEFELKLHGAEYSKFIQKGNSNESVKAKRVEFKNDKFMYLTDSRSLLVLENFNQTAGKSLYIQKSRIDGLSHGDVIAFLKTERELLDKIVGKQASPSALAETTKWIELWKSLLKIHFKLLNNDLNKLVSQLKEKGCNRDQVTIRSWLFDELRIGPRKDDDLLAIAILTNGTELYDNIKMVRAAIKQMTSWRMQASDFVIEQLKRKIKKSYSEIQVNTIVDFENLGEVEILEITEINSEFENIDTGNVNRLLEKTKL